MKIKCLVALLGLTFAGASFADDNAAGGTINFSGAISDTTCTINGGKSADMTVALSPITVTDAGTTANSLITKNKKSISLTFSNCTPAAEDTSSTLKIYFSSAQNISTDGKYLINDTVNEADPDVAKNVGFALTKTGSTTPISLNEPLDTQITGSTASSDTVNLDVYYYKTNSQPAKVGALNSSVIYTVSYL